MDIGVRETLCSKCLHCQVCGHKKNYLAMVKRLEDLFYSVPEEDRDAVVLQDPACKFNQKKMEVPSFVNYRIETSGALNTDKIFRQACLPAKKNFENVEVVS